MRMRVLGHIVLDANMMAVQATSNRSRHDIGNYAQRSGPYILI